MREETELNLQEHEGKEYVMDPPNINKEQKKLAKVRGFERKKRMKTGDWMSYEEAKALVQMKGINSVVQFSEWSKSEDRPFNFPSLPPSVYKRDWVGWGEFLGTGRVVSKEWMSYEEAKSFIQGEGITSESVYRRWKKAGHRPPNFPAHPERVYKEKWVSWGDFFRSGRVASKE